MPARKPLGLQTKHATKADKKARSEAESGLSPRTALPTRPPDELKGHARAQATWKYTVKIYSELSTKIISSLDMGILTDYCLLVEQLIDLEELRTQNTKALRLVQDNLQKILKDKAKDPASIIAQQLSIIDKMQGLTEAFYKLDQRADRKRTLIHTLRQSLYLTPRARAGTVPAGKEDEPEKDEMERLLEAIS